MLIKAPTSRPTPSRPRNGPRNRASSTVPPSNSRHRCQSCAASDIYASVLQLHLRSAFHCQSVLQLTLTPGRQRHRLLHASPGNELPRSHANHHRTLTPGATRPVASVRPQRGHQKPGRQPKHHSYDGSVVNRSRIAGYDATVEIQIALPAYDVCVATRSAHPSKRHSYDQNLVNPSLPSRSSPTRTIQARLSGHK